MGVVDSMALIAGEQCALNVIHTLYKGEN